MAASEQRTRTVREGARRETHLVRRREADTSFETNAELLAQGFVGYAVDGFGGALSCADNQCVARCVSQTFRITRIQSYQIT